MRVFRFQRRFTYIKIPSPCGEGFNVHYFTIWIGLPIATSAVSIVISPKVG